MYVGPGFRDSMLSTYAIFADGIPDEYKNHPTYKHLFVAPENLNDARELIRKKGSVLNIMFRAAVAEHEKQKGGK